MLKRFVAGVLGVSLVAVMLGFATLYKPVIAQPLESNQVSEKVVVVDSVIPSNHSVIVESGWNCGQPLQEASIIMILQEWCGYLSVTQSAPVAPLAVVKPQSQPRLAVSTTQPQGPLINPESLHLPQGETLDAIFSPIVQVGLISKTTGILFTQKIRARTLSQSFGVIETVTVLRC